jgi:hypothetical protein
VEYINGNHKFNKMYSYFTRTFTIRLITPNRLGHVSCGSRKLVGYDHEKSILHSFIAFGSSVEPHEHPYYFVTHYLSRKTMLRTNHDECLQIFCRVFIYCRHPSTHLHIIVEIVFGRIPRSFRTLIDCVSMSDIVCARSL